MTKAGAQRYASELGICLIAPDTSPSKYTCIAAQVGQLYFVGLVKNEEYKSLIGTNIQIINIHYLDRAICNVYDYLYLLIGNINFYRGM